MKKLLSLSTTIATTLALGASMLPASAASLGFAARSFAQTPAIGFRSQPRQPYSGTLALIRRGARYLGHASVPLMTIDVSTPLRNEGALKAYAQAANTPGSLYYRKWLNPTQLGSSFGTPQAQYAATASYFAKYGLVVKQWNTRNLVTLTGSSKQFENALGTTFGRYAIRNRYQRTYSYFNAPDYAPVLPASIGATSMTHLISLAMTRLHFMTTSPPQPISAGFANARVNGASPAQIAGAYDYKSAYEAGFTGKGINLGIVGTGPISPADVPNMRSIFKTPGSSTVTIVPATVNGDSTPPPATGPCPASNAGTSTSPTTGCNPEDIEAQLDTEQTSLLAYDANVLFFLAYNGSGCEVEGNPIGSGCIGPASTSQGLDLSDDELMTAVNDNTADILSLSYGICEVLDTGTLGLTVTPGGDATGTDPTIFAQLAAEGIAVFVSSGDSGSAGCQRSAGGSDAPNLSYPSSDPNVVAVGGTTTPIGPDGRLTGPITTWGEQTESGGAEGAGVSVDFQTPSFQKGALAACIMRCAPDVVADADPFTGAAVVYNSGLSGGAMEEPVGGTSQAAPDMAAMWALVLSACKQTTSCGGGYSSHVADPATPPTGGAASPAYRLGNPNYLWYKLDTAANATAYHNVFYDVVYGNDGVPPYALQEAGGVVSGEGVPVSEYAAGVDPGDVSAGTGFDEATGLGAPFARNLIRYIVGV